MRAIFARSRDAGLLRVRTEGTADVTVLMVGAITRSSALAIVVPA